MRNRALHKYKTFYSVILHYFGKKEKQRTIRLFFLDTEEGDCVTGREAEPRQNATEQPRKARSIAAAGTFEGGDLELAAAWNAGKKTVKKPAGRKRTGAWCAG
jgi:hypothetical protein